MEWLPLLKAATLALWVTGEHGRPVRLGTGFVVSGGLVATCAHVVAEDSASLPSAVQGQIVATGGSLSLRPVGKLYFRDENTGLDLAFLRADEAELPGPALLSDRLTIGDQLWTYGHPDGVFRAGQPATFHYEGGSRRSTTKNLELPRLRGTPVGGGFSGSPVVNLRTGAVCGMLCTSDHQGSAHMLPVAEIIERSGETPAFERQAPQWLLSLSDEQLREGRWRIPDRRLRRFMEAFRGLVEAQPYPGVLPGVATPPLTSIYVKQQAALPAERRPSGARRPPAERRPDPARTSAVPSWDDIMFGPWHTSPVTADQPAARADHPVAADILLSTTKDAVVVAGPGSGKSCLLRMLVAHLSEQWREDPHGREVPILVQAAALLDSVGLPATLRRAIQADLAAAGSLDDLPENFFREPPLPQGKWLVLVDGLDEVLDEEQRQAILAKIHGAQRSADGSPYRFIVATRPLPGHELGDWLQRYTLLPLTPEDVPALAERWFVVLGVPDHRRTARRLHHAITRARLDGLARIPLMAAILCQLYAADPARPLPAGKVAVFEEFIELVRTRPFNDRAGGLFPQTRALLAKWGEGAVVAAEGVVPRLLPALSEAAFELFRSEGESIDVERLAETLPGDYPAHVGKQVHRLLVQELVRRSGLVIQRGGAFYFVHQSIGEFLAARHVAATEDLHRWAAANIAGLLLQWGEEFTRPIRLADLFVMASLRSNPLILAVVQDRLRHDSGLLGVGRVMSEGVDLPRGIRAAVTERLAERSSTEADAAMLLADLGEPRGGDRLLGMALDTSLEPQIRWQAAEYLDQLGVDTAVAAFMSMALAPGMEVDYKLAAAARAVGRGGREILTPVIELLVELGPSGFRRDTIAHTRHITERLDRDSLLRLCRGLAARPGFSFKLAGDILRRLRPEKPDADEWREAVYTFLVEAAGHPHLSTGEKLSVIEHTLGYSPPPLLLHRLLTQPRVAPSVRIWAVKHLDPGDAEAQKMGEDHLRSLVADPLVAGTDRRQAALVLHARGYRDSFDAILADARIGNVVRLEAGRDLLRARDERGIDLLAEAVADSRLEVETRIRAGLDLAAVAPRRGAELLLGIVLDPGVDDRSHRHAIRVLAGVASETATKLLTALMREARLDTGIRRMVLGYLAARTFEDAAEAWIGLPDHLAADPAALRLMLMSADPVRLTDDILDQLESACMRRGDAILHYSLTLLHLRRERGTATLRRALDLLRDRGYDHAWQVRILYHAHRTGSVTGPAELRALAADTSRPEEVSMVARRCLELLGQE